MGASLCDGPNGLSMRVVMAVQTKHALLPGLVVVDGRAEGAVPLGAGLAVAGAGGTRRPFAVRAGEGRRPHVGTGWVRRMCVWMRCRGIGSTGSERRGGTGGCAANCRGLANLKVRQERILLPGTSSSTCSSSWS